MNKKKVADCSYICKIGGEGIFERNPGEYVCGKLRGDCVILKTYQLAATGAWSEEDVSGLTGKPRRKYELSFESLKDS